MTARMKNSKPALAACLSALLATACGINGSPEVAASLERLYTLEDRAMAILDAEGNGPLMSSAQRELKAVQSKAIEDAMPGCAAKARDQFVRAIDQFIQAGKEPVQDPGGRQASRQWAAYLDAAEQCWVSVKG